MSKETRGAVFRPISAAFSPEARYLLLCERYSHHGNPLCGLIPYPGPYSPPACAVYTVEKGNRLVTFALHEQDAASPQHFRSWVLANEPLWLRDAAGEIVIRREASFGYEDPPEDAIQPFALLGAYGRARGKRVPSEMYQMPWYRAPGEPLKQFDDVLLVRRAHSNIERAYAVMRKDVGALKRWLFRSFGDIKVTLIGRERLCFFDPPIEVSNLPELTVPTPKSPVPWAF